MNSIVLLLALACNQTEDSPRLIYNEGLAALNEGRFEEASTKLLEARDLALGDAELRQFASYNLALAHSRMGMQKESEEPEGASEQYGHAVAWFRDSLQLNPEDEEARVNLEVVLKRIQLLADRLNAGNNSLEKRLEVLLDDTRTIRDQVRTIDVQIDKGVSPDDLSSAFEQLAIQVRDVQAQASTTIQLSSNELSNLSNKAEAERTDEENMRMAQLTSLSYHLEKGRDQIADARRVLRRLDVEKSLQRLDFAVRTIHRAREQLLDPLVVLQSIAQEEGQLTQQTNALAVQKNPGIFISNPEKIPKLPSWFDAKLLSEEQSNIHERSDEILQRFSFATAQEAPEGTQPNPEQDAFLALVKDAIPPLAKAVVYMKAAEQELSLERYKEALEQESQAQRELAKAIERFADAKNVIELAYETQQGLVMLLTPPSEGATLPVELTEEQRFDAVSKGLQENVSRIERLQGALQREKQQQLQQIPPQEEGAAEGEDPQASVEQFFSRAEELRVNTLKALQAMNEAIIQEGEVLVHAKEAQKSIEELRILFFSIVEHLKQLLEQQSVLRDETGTLISDKYERMIDGIGYTLSQQSEMMQMAGAIAEELQKQADAASQGGDQEKAGSFAEAYAQTSVAQDAMQDAIDLLQQVKNEEGGESHDPQPVLDYQQQAMEALMAAIQALQPPQQNPDSGDDKQEQQEQQEQMSKQQAERRMQAAKEREEERAKKRQEASASDPVEKDW